MGKILWLLWLPALFFPACSKSDIPDSLCFKDTGLLILSIDTLRADRLGCYGNERGLTPNLDGLAKEGIVFENMYANSPKTASSHMSIFTSMQPTVHGVTNYSPRLKIPLVTLAGNRLTLGQILNRNGYWNVAVASGANLQAAMGFRKGFGNRFTSSLRPVGEIVEEALFKAEGALSQKKKPFFFVHTYQVHAPYVPPPEYVERFASNPRGYVSQLVEEMKGLDFSEQWRSMHEGLWNHKEKFGDEDAAYLMDLYDGEVAYTDGEVGRLFEGLRRMGWLEKMVVVVLSDHGEEFGEHGDYEHDQLYGEHLHVPLIIRLPEGVHGGTRVNGLCSLLDVMPTLLDLLELKGPEKQMMGQSLVPAILSGRTSNDPILAERVMYADAYQATLKSRKGSVIFRAKESSLEAYNLTEDPGEHQDVAWEAPFFEDASASLKLWLTRVFGQRAAWDSEAKGEAAQLDEEALEELKQLGYLSGEGEDFKLPQGSPLERWPTSAPKEGDR